MFGPEYWSVLFYYNAISESDFVHLFYIYLAPRNRLNQTMHSAGIHVQSLYCVFSFGLSCIHVRIVLIYSDF